MKISDTENNKMKNDVYYKSSESSKLRALHMPTLYGRLVSDVRSQRHVPTAAHLPVSFQNH